MSIDRITRERLFKDEGLFNSLLPYAKYDDEKDLFIHTDASLWSLWELNPLWILKVSDQSAFKICENFQELCDSLEHTMSVQVSWITTFDVEEVLSKCINGYPTSGPAGWMARRWVRSMKHASTSDYLHRRPRKMRLVIAFRYDPPWRAQGILDQISRSIKILLSPKEAVTTDRRKAEYDEYAAIFKGSIDGKASKLSEMGFQPKRIDGQGLINLLYPILNRRSVKAGKFRRGRNTTVPLPVYDSADILSNQISETHTEHLDNGIIKKDGRIFRTVSMVKPPRYLLPLMIAPLQSMPYEHILTITFSKDEREKQLKRLDRLDSTLGFREFGATGRGNQKIQHQVASVRAARDELYSARAQIVRVGIHQTFICQNQDEAIRATSEAIATMPQLNGARGMVHEISDMAVLINSLPGCYDPSTDGPGWTNVMRSSRASRLFPLWGNWRGSQGALIVLPSLWNRELIGLDLYDSNIAPNVLISGVSGAGKSYLLCYLITTLNRGNFSTSLDGRIIEKKPITFIFDKGMAGQPCGFEKLAQLFGGRIYEASPSKAPAMNFLARLGSTPPDNKHEDYKDLVDMCADIICDMATEGSKIPDRLERVAINDSVIEAHRIYRSSAMKRELILSDVISVLRAPKRVEEDAESASRRHKLALLTSDYHSDGTFARFFDRPGALTLKERFIVFDLKALNRNPDLQRVFLKIAMLWADSVMNDQSEMDSRKILVFDEAHDLIGKTSANTIETAFRLYRKRKGIVIAASQSGEDFYVGSGGQAIVQNSAHKIFLRQDPSKFHFTAQAFNLNQQQSDVILRLKTIKGLESQFYLLSDIGEVALCLPVEAAFYWVSTNNGDDNRYFTELLKECDNNFYVALDKAIRQAPNGIQGVIMDKPEEEKDDSQVSNVVKRMIDSSMP